MKPLRSRLGSDEGVALIAALLVLGVISGLALALLLTSNSQQKAGLREQASESAFNVAEASLNAQVSQLNRAWPGKSSEAYPDEKTNKLVRCTAATSASTNGCPDAAGIATAYPNISPVPCAAGTSGDKWGSALSNEWTTYVRDDAEGTGALFNSAAEQSQPGWDANGDGKMWVVSVGVVQCRLVKAVTLVSRQAIAVPFPKNVVVANWFETTNNGKKVIVDTKGESSQTSNMSLRCSPPPSGKKCAEYQKAKGQVSPGEVIESESGTSPAIPTGQLESLRKQAEASGTYYATGTCPKGLPSGQLVYVEGPCNISGGGNEVANSKEAPGFLIIANGTLSMGGTSTFYGVIYAVNKQGATGAVVSTSGNSEIVGAIDIDGSAGASLGSSGTNVVYSSKAIEELKSFAGATATRNSFRILRNSE